MLFEDYPFLAIHWDEKVRCVIMEWKGFAAGENFKKGLNQGLKLIEEKKASRWLADLRKIGTVGKEDQAWSNEDWFPRGVKGGIKAMALVVPESALAKFSVDQIMSKAEGIDMVTHYFSSVDEAKDWLAKQ